MTDNSGLEDLVAREVAPEELERALVYFDEALVAEGASVGCFDTVFPMPFEGYIGFIDLDPRADWGHECRYVLVAADSGEVRVLEGRFPPFFERVPETLKLVLRYGEKPFDDRSFEP